jgi:xanthine dehydrogenase YagR molybdenum-binding subunit
MSKPKAAGPDDLPTTQDDRTHWNGQPVALVLAETQEQADYAQSLIRVRYEEQNPVIALAAAKAKRTESGLFMGEPLKQKVGDAEAALVAAPHKVDVVYTTPRHHHAPIELHACTLAWEGDTLRIHDASQAVAHEAWTIAQVFGLKENQVRLMSPFVGGFGGKLL